jgi:hypothetical protein
MPEADRELMVENERDTRQLSLSCSSHHPLQSGLVETGHAELKKMAIICLMLVCLPITCGGFQAIGAVQL